VPNYAATVIPLLKSIVDQVMVSANQFEMKLTFGSLIGQAGSNYHAPPEAWISFDWSSLKHPLMLPIQIKRSGWAVKLMIEPPGYRIKRLISLRRFILLPMKKRCVTTLFNAENKARIVRKLSGIRSCSGTEND